MQLTWIGQAGLLFETAGKKILVDPYLSDSVAKVQPRNFRRLPVDESLFALKPDVIVITHNHLDHLDKETLCHYLTEDSEVLLLAPDGAWQETRKFGGAKNNYVLFNNGTTWTEPYATLRAVKAEHSDAHAIGVILMVEGKNYYVTGDTLYSERVFESLPPMPIEMLFVPVNGVGNNMNPADAYRFAKRIGAKVNVPIHVGMFDKKRPEDIDLPNRKVLTVYKTETV
jgi:L-ascorbate metabolism protein UlaG (beta-lactamase superfamily)